MHRLLEREHELDRLGALVERICGGQSAVAVVQGPAGIGKTRLIESVRALATERGATVLSARGSERERAYPFGVLRQLLEPTVSASGVTERRALFSGAAAHAETVFDTAPASGSDAPPPPGYAMLHGLYWLLVAIAGGGPVLVTVDDMHWADDPSARFLAYLEPRLEGLGVALVLATRPREPGAEDGLLADLARDPRTEVITPQPLSLAAVHRLASETLGADADEPFASACWGSTGGNPFFLSALLGELDRGGVTPTRAEAPRVNALGPDSVLRSILLRLATLPSGALALAQAVAVLGDGTAVADAAALASIEASGADDAAEALRDVGIFSEAERLTFAHPIVQAALYRDLTASRRSRRHAQAAELLRRNGAPADDVAAHLLLTAPGADAATVATLRTAAGGAVARGAPEIAATYLLRALAESPGADLEHALLLELGEAEARAGLSGCVLHLHTALRSCRDPQRRVAAAMLLARVLCAANRATEGVATLTELADELAASEPLLAARVEAELRSIGDIELPVRAVVQGRQLPSPTGDRLGDQRTAGLAHTAVAASLAGVSARAAAEAATAALADGELLADALAGGQHFFLIATMLIYAEAYEPARSRYDEAIVESVARGSALAFVGASLGRALLNARSGSLIDAEADARAAAATAQLNAWPMWQLHTCTHLAGALLERGDARSAAAAIAAAQPTGGLGTGTQETVLLEMRGRVRLALDEPEGAVDDLLECGRRFARWGLHNPSAFAWRSGAALGLVRLGQRERAAELAEDEVTLARRWGSPRALGVALHRQALVTGGERATALLEAATATLAGSQARVEYARALTDLGAALRRANQRTAARVPLRAGLEIAHACGAVSLVEHAHTELAATGARPRTPLRRGIDALTPSELRIARMAATGLSNPAIAQALFVTIKTIEMHLTSTYRKLDITSRGAITTALNGDPQGPEDRRLAIAVAPSIEPPVTEPRTILRLEA